MQWPAVDDSNGEAEFLLPQYGPKIHVFSQGGEYKGWKARLLSITLLEPLVQLPNYETEDSNHWRSRKIVMYGTQGIKVAFDSCACPVYLASPEN